MGQRHEDQAVARHTPLVFVVDDESFVGVMLESVVAICGCEARVFTDPAEAWRAFHDANPRPDVLITDYKMPEMTGGELIELCCNDHPGLKTVLISGHVDQSVLDKLPTRPDRFLTKPFYPRDLVDTIRDLLGGGRG